MDDIEWCDRCDKELDRLKNEDIYLEKIDSVVCAECHTEADRKYW